MATPERLTVTLPADDLVLPSVPGTLRGMQSNILRPDLEQSGRGVNAGVPIREISPTTPAHSSPTRLMSPTTHVKACLSLGYNSHNLTRGNPIPWHQLSYENYTRSSSLRSSLLCSLDLSSLHSSARCQSPPNRTVVLHTHPCQPPNIYRLGIASRTPLVPILYVRKSSGL